MKTKTLSMLLIFSFVATHSLIGMEKFEDLEDLSLEEAHARVKNFEQAQEADRIAEAELRKETRTILGRMGQLLDDLLKNKNKQKLALKEGLSITELELENERKTKELDELELQLNRLKKSLGIK